MKDRTNSLERLKKDVVLWLCDVNFWNDEINACQNLLEKNLPKIDILSERKRLEQFQNHIIYYRDELLPQVKQDLRHLKEKLSDQTRINGSADIHNEYSTKVDAIHDQMKEKRRQIDLFVNNI